MRFRQRLTSGDKLSNHPSSPSSCLRVRFPVPFSFFRLFLPLDLLEGPYDGIHTRIIVDIVNVDVADDAFLVDDENGPFRNPFPSENIVFQRNMPMGPEIAQHGEGKVVTLRPSLEAWDIIRKNTQNLGVGGGEEVPELLIRGQLARSDRCEGRG